MNTLKRLITPATIASPYGYWIDLLRGVAAVTILFWHYQHFGLSSRDLAPFYDWFRYLYDYGELAVWLFWVISGFVFAQVYLIKRGTRWDFFINRFARLYPLHFLTLLVVALLQFISFKQSGLFLIYLENDWYYFFLNVLFIPHWGFQAGRSFNAPIWSVSVELLIYLIFWFSLALIAKRGMMSTLAYVGAFFGLYALGVPGSAFWLCGFFFFLGASVYILIQACRDSIARLLQVATILLLSALITRLFLCVYIDCVRVVVCII